LTCNNKNWITPFPVHGSELPIRIPKNIQRKKISKLILVFFSLNLQEKPITIRLNIDGNQSHLFSIGSDNEKIFNCSKDYNAVEIQNYTIKYNELTIEDVFLPEDIKIEGFDFSDASPTNFFALSNISYIIQQTCPNNSFAVSNNPGDENTMQNSGAKCECKKGYFRDESEIIIRCLPCQEHCEECKGPFDADCLSCKSGYELFERVCRNRTGKKFILHKKF
jgi:hypothetical protein